jgi:hypothetical protein
LTYTDEEPPQQANPVTPARRPASAEAKASRQRDADGRPYLSFQGLLDHLATLTRNELRFPDTPASVPVLTEPTSRQREAFDLIGAPIPLTLGKQPKRPGTPAAKAQASGGLEIPNQLSRPRDWHPQTQLQRHRQRSAGTSPAPT